MSDTEPKPKASPIVRASDRTAASEQAFSHPFNPASQLHGHSLSDPAGLQRVALHVLRVPAGKESFVYHRHEREEEFLYVLSGRAVIEIGDDKHELGPGDFVGFPAPSVAHHLTNPFDEDLVYLSGGERRDVEISEFPRHGKRMVRMGQKIMIYPLDAEKFPGFE
jgi:uncharacterized cupin superfamily protein